MLTCPICQQSLVLAQKSYRCPSNHSFDIAKEGYVNLHVVQHKKSKNPGDTPESVAARRRFLGGGFYTPLQMAIRELLADLGVSSVLDIGCGEGYYTAAIADVADTVIGVDIAKSAVQTAARSDKAGRVTWVVGTSSLLPVADGSVDVCTSFFSPLPVDEMARVLTDDGYALIATPAPRHLYAMREALFGEVKLHEPAKFIETLAPTFTLVSEELISSDFSLKDAEIADLLAMTPYAYKAKLERRAALERMESLAVRAEFMLYLFKKS